MDRPLRPATPTWIGVVVGIVALAAVACFAIFLPEAGGDDDSRSSDDTASADADATGSSKEPLTLPDRLVGGFVASDLPEAFVGSEFAAQAEQIAEGEAKNRTYADGVLSAVLDESVATRVYAGPKASSRVSIKAFRAAGGAFAPVELPDPASAAEGQPVTRFLRQDGAACSVTIGSAPTNGQAAPATPPTDATCQQARDGVTVQLTAQSLELPEMTKLLGAVLDELT